MKLAFHTLDVFTDTPFTGNPLAVFPDAPPLADAAMQTIARELNLSETVFVQPPEHGGLAKLRIFTPGTELPFAGHPTIGTAFLLAWLGRAPTPGGLGAEESRWRRSPHGTGDGLGPAPEPVGEAEIVFEEGVGPIKVRLCGSGGRLRFAQLEARASELGPRPPRTPALAAMLGLTEDDLDHPTLGPTFVSAGGRFLVVPLRDVDALGRARLQMGEWQRTLADQWSPQVYLVAGDPDGGLGAAEFRSRRSPRGQPDVPFRVRMFAPGIGITEDPATGAAAVAFAGMLGARDPRPDGVLAWTLLQGIEMGRPSRLEIEAVKRGGEVVATRVGGTAVRVSTGEMELPA